MIGDSAFAVFIDRIFAYVVEVLKVIMDFLITALFYNKFIAFFLAFIVINLIAIILMKRDKEYANTPGARRISERMLLIVALVGGALGEYYAMYKFKHKTMHKNFLYIVPLAIVFHFALLSYNLLIGILG